jgi:hypothetical protein
MMRFYDWFYDWILILIFVAEGPLLYYLGAGRVPPPIKPIASAWSRAGYDPKWVTVALWGLVALIAIVFLLLIGIPMFRAIEYLGTPPR